MSTTNPSILSYHTRIDIIHYLSSNTLGTSAGPVPLGAPICPSSLSRPLFRPSYHACSRHATRTSHDNLNFVAIITSFLSLLIPPFLFAFSFLRRNENSDPVYSLYVVSLLLTFYYKLGGQNPTSPDRCDTRLLFYPNRRRIYGLATSFVVIVHTIDDNNEIDEYRKVNDDKVQFDREHPSLRLCDDIQGRRDCVRL